MTGGDFRIDATYRFATPAFIGGAQTDDQSRRDVRFSVDGFRGILRFWWRALVWPECYAAARGESADDLTRRALQKLHRREREAFGAAALDRDESSGQSPLSIVFRGFRSGRKAAAGQALSADGTGIAGARRHRLDVGARYLGFGLVHAFGQNGGELARACLTTGTEFDLTLRFAMGREGERASVIGALKLMAMLGGLGARSRRGWGSLALTSLAQRGGAALWQAPTTREAYMQTLRSLLPSPLPDQSPPFTALWQNMRIEVVDQASLAVPLLGKIGHAMQRHRAWGQQGRVGEMPSEKNFENDHDWFRRPELRILNNWVPRRAAYGLPQNYSKDVGVSPAGSSDRRASPLFIHIHRLAEHDHLAVLAFLPADFLSDDQVALNHRGRYGSANPSVRPMPADWPDVIHELFDGPPTRNPRASALPPYFANRHPVFDRGA